jgi:glycerol-3-phosphate dehydrogenase
MKKTDFDLIIIGGGATGAGIALDASLRGLSVALFEQNDFGEGTSSRSTKLVHGGVRYLEAAVKKLDKSQYALVKEGLKERKLFLNNAKHLAHPIELITPIYRWWEVPYVYAGLFLYDLISGKASLGRSRLLSRSKALSLNPAINATGLKAAVSYYDGAFNDSRMVIALLQSAQAQGAKVYNHHQITSLHKEAGVLSGITVLDKLANHEKQYHASVILNATGPFVDTIRRLDDPTCTPIIQASSGIHIIVDSKFLPSSKGIMIPQTSDGRVLFVLPYQGKCMIGTSDNPSALTEHPEVTDTEIGYLLENVNHYFGIKVTPEDILGRFSGLRPLLVQEDTTDTAMLVREHIETFSDAGLLTLAGGKWTSYRSMAESAVDMVLQKLGKRLSDHPCKTEHYALIGSQHLKEEPSLPTSLFQRYGDQASKIVKIATEENAEERLHEELETSKAELLYTIRYEYVRKPLDFIVRRVNLGLIDQADAQKLLPPVLLVLKEEFDLTDSTLLTLEEESLALLRKAI